MFEPSTNGDGGPIDIVFSADTLLNMFAASVACLGQHFSRREGLTKGGDAGISICASVSLTAPFVGGQEDNRGPNADRIRGAVSQERDL